MWLCPCSPNDLATVQCHPDCDRYPLSNFRETYAVSLCLFTYSLLPYLIVLVFKCALVVQIGSYVHFPFPQKTEARWRYIVKNAKSWQIGSIIYQQSKPVRELTWSDILIKLLITFIYLWGLLVIGSWLEERCIRLPCNS